MRLALALLATLLIAAPAQAAATKVTWPEARAYGAGEQIAISVKGDRKVKVSVLRVSASGKVMSSVVRRTLKRGSVTATVFGPDGGATPTIQDWARWAGTIPHTIVTGIGPRVRRSIA